MQMADGKIEGIEDANTKSLNRLLQSRLVSLYKTSFITTMECATEDHASLLAGSLLEHHPLPSSQRHGSSVAGRDHQDIPTLEVQEGGGVMETLLSSLSKLNSNLSSIDSKLAAALHDQEDEKNVQGKGKLSTKPCKNGPSINRRSSGATASSRTSLLPSPIPGRVCSTLGKTPLQRSPIPSFIALDHTPDVNAPCDPENPKNSPSTTQGTIAGGCKNSTPVVPKAKTFLPQYEARKIFSFQCQLQGLCPAHGKEDLPHKAVTSDVGSGRHS